MKRLDGWAFFVRTTGIAGLIRGAPLVEPHKLSWYAGALVLFTAYSIAAFRAAKERKIPVKTLHFFDPFFLAPGIFLLGGPAPLALFYPYVMAIAFRFSLLDALTGAAWCSFLVFVMALFQSRPQLFSGETLINPAGFLICALLVAFVKMLFFSKQVL